MAEDKNKNQQAAMVPMIAPDGTSGDVSADRVHAAILAGYKVGVNMRAPDGTVGTVSSDRAAAASQAGYTMIPWGEPDDSKEGFFRSGWDAVKGAGEGLINLFRPSDTPGENVISGTLGAVALPVERMIESQIEGSADLTQRAHEDARAAAATQDPALRSALEEKASGEQLAAFLPGGPWAQSVAEKAGQQYVEGDYPGMAGTLMGNTAVAIAPSAIKGAAEVIKEAGPGRLAEFQAPAADLNQAASPGDLTPKQRYDAATRMGVNLDRAQATGASVPRMAKQVTEHSLLGKKSFEENNASNAQALHQEAQRIANDAGGGKPVSSREDFGNFAKSKLQTHRASLTDDAGQRADAQQLLDSASPNAMTREQFGDAVKNAMEKHRTSIDEQERGLYEGLDDRLGERGPDMSAVRKKAQSIYSQNKRFYENHPEALSGADARVWKWVKDLAGEGKEEKTVSTQGAPKPGDTWADLQRARSHLLDVTRGPEFVGDLATGWAKQLTGAIDETMTSAEHTPGLSQRDVQDFRTANSLHKELKDTYDNPQNPFYWVSREGGLRAADRLNSLQPKEVQQFNDAMRAGDRKDLVGQLKRQTMNRLLDPAGNGDFDLAGVASRWDKVPKEQVTGILGRGYRSALDGLADRTKAQTVYDAPGSRLAQIIDAQDGLAASRVMFNDNGSLRLTPEDMRTMGQADPNLVPMLRQHAISRLFDPAASGTPDVANFASRWGRAQKEPLQGLLTPDQMQDLDELSSVSRAVNLKSNPSGTATVLQPVGEVKDLVSGAAEAGKGIGRLAMDAAAGHSVAGPVGAVAGPLVDTLGSKFVAERLTNPEATEAVMNHQPPIPVTTAVKNALQDAHPAVTAPLAAVTADSQSARDRFKQTRDAQPQAQPTPPGPVTPQEPQTAKDQFRNSWNARAGVSTPPNGGQVTSETTTEPNEVHDEAQQQNAVSAPPTPAPASTGVSSLRDEQGNTIYQAPEGATHEVLHPDDQSVLGHIVNGEYVPLSQ